MRFMLLFSFFSIERKKMYGNICIPVNPRYPRMLCSCILVAICCCLINASVSMPATWDGFKNLLNNKIYFKTLPFRTPKKNAYLFGIRDNKSS